MSKKSGTGPDRETGGYRALFLMHHFNDLDHACPVIAALAEKGNWQCDLVLYPESVPLQPGLLLDPRINYLQALPGVCVHSLHEIDTLSRITEILIMFRNKLLSLCKKTPRIGSLFGKDLRAVLPWFLVLKALEMTIRVWITRGSFQGRRVIEAMHPDVLAVDWGLNHPAIQSVLLEAARRDIGIIQLPHGAWTYEGIYSQILQLNPDKMQKRQSLPVAWPIATTVDNVYGAWRFEERGWPQQSLRVIGLPRFTKSWVRRLQAIIEDAQTPPQTGKPRIVWFSGGYPYGPFRQLLTRTVQVLEGLGKRLDIVIKMHTRYPLQEMVEHSGMLGENSNVRIAGDEYQSLALSAWCDVVMITQSSVAYDALLLGKPVLYLQYTHPLDCTWDIDGAVETIKSPDHLERVLFQIADGKFKPSATPQAIKRFLRLCVDGGLDEDGVKQAYIEMFEQVADGKSVTAGQSVEQAERQWKVENRPLGPKLMPFHTERAGALNQDEA